MDRRAFLLLTATTMATNLFAKKVKKIDLRMNGDLDDDLFIVKSSTNNCLMTHCFQMHNPKNIFNYIGKSIKSMPIYGQINFSESIELSNNEVIATFVANEREELYDIPKLRERTHFKAVPLFVNNKILIPSLLPENNDVPDYPTWFGSESEVCNITQQANDGYNYYKLWENAVCGCGIIISEESKIVLKAFNDNEEIMFTYNSYINKNAIQLVSDEIKNDDFEKHVLAEIDGFVYNQNHSYVDDEFVKKNAITKFILYIEKSNLTIPIYLPYPLPYPNRIFMIAIGDI